MSYFRHESVDKALVNIAGRMRFSSHGVNAFVNSACIQYPQNTKTLKFYRRFKDKYSSPSKYCSWQKVVRSFSKYVAPGYIINNLDPFSKNEGAGFHRNCCFAVPEEGGSYVLDRVVPMLTTAYFKKAPAFYITNEMATALANTEVPAQAEPQKVLDAFFIVLPEGFLEKVLGLNTESHDAFLVTSQAGMSYGVKTAEKAFSFMTRWVNIDKGNADPSLHFALCGNGKYLSASTKWSDPPKTTNAQLINIGIPKSQALADDAQHKIANLLKNIILIYNYQPEHVSEEKTANKIYSKGFAGNTIKTKYPIRWIGKNFRCKTVQSDKPSDQSSRRVFKSHWRRGHWHHYWAGAGRRQSVLRWVQPVYVRGLNMHS